MAEKIDLRNSEITEVCMLRTMDDMKYYSLMPAGTLRGSNVLEIADSDSDLSGVLFVVDNNYKICKIFVPSDKVNNEHSSILEMLSNCAIETGQALKLDSGKIIRVEEAGSLNEKMDIFECLGGHTGEFVVVNGDMVPLFMFKYSPNMAYSFQSTSAYNIFDL